MNDTIFEPQVAPEQFEDFSEIDAPEPSQEDYESLAEEEAAWAEEEEIQREAEANYRAWESQTAKQGFIYMNRLATCPHKTPEAIVEKLIYPGSLTILAGDPKAGKSTFLLHALDALATGKDFCGLKTRRVNTLYASEQSLPSLYSQVQRLPSYRNNSHVAVIPWEFNFDVKNGNKIFPKSWLEQVKLWHARLKNAHGGLLVVDTFTSFAQFNGGEAFDSGPVTNRLQQLKSLQSDIPDLAICVNHHLRKEDFQRGGKRTFADIANSYALRAASDTNIILYRPSNKREDSNLRELQIESRFLEDVQTLRFRKNGSEFTEETGELTSPVAEKIRAAIQANPELDKLSIRVLADTLKVTKSAVERYRQSNPQTVVDRNEE